MKKEFRKISIDNIKPDPNQPRRSINGDTINGLAASFGDEGPDQPLVVRPEDDSYIIVTGERRWRAAKLRGYTELECIVRSNMDEKDVLLAQLKENQQRENLHPLETGRAYVIAMKEYGLSERKLSELLGIGKTTLHDNAYLAKNLSGRLADQIGEGVLGLSPTQAVEIAKLKPAGKQYELANIIVKYKITESHHLRQLVQRVNLAMKKYGNIPMNRHKNASTPSLEAIAKEVLHIGNGRYTPREKKSYCNQVYSQITELSSALNPWQIQNIPASEIARIKEALENLILKINHFQKVCIEHTSDNIQATAEGSNPILDGLDVPDQEQALLDIVSMDEVVGSVRRIAD